MGIDVKEGGAWWQKCKLGRNAGHGWVGVWVCRWVCARNAATQHAKHTQLYARNTRYNKANNTGTMTATRVPYIDYVPSDSTVRHIGQPTPYKRSQRLCVVGAGRHEEEVIPGSLFRRVFCSGVGCTMCGAMGRTRIHNYLRRTASRSVCLALRIHLPSAGAYVGTKYCYNYSLHTNQKTIKLSDVSLFPNINGMGHLMYTKKWSGMLDWYTLYDAYEQEFTADGGSIFQSRITQRISVPHLSWHPPRVHIPRWSTRCRSSRIPRRA